MLHKLWSWCTVEPRLLIEVLRILSTLTAQFPKGAYSVKPMSLVAVYFALTFLQHWRVKKQQTAYLTTWLFFPAFFLWPFTVWRWRLSWKTREKINFATIVLVYFNYRVSFLSFLWCWLPFSSEFAFFQSLSRLFDVLVAVVVLASWTSYYFFCSISIYRWQLRCPRKRQPHRTKREHIFTQSYQADQ